MLKMNRFRDRFLSLRYTHSDKNKVNDCITNIQMLLDALFRNSTITEKVKNTIKYYNK